MKNKFKYLALLPVIASISCGYSASYLVPGDQYNSPIFANNYYRHWDAELKNATKVAAKDVNDSKIVNFNDLDKIDPNFALPGAPDSAEKYGVEYKMNSVDDMFNYGYQSKLFDGQMVCGAQDGHLQYAYQLGRVQIDSNGFSVRFSKESSELHYFAMQFKASTDNTVDCYPVNSDDISEYGSAGHDNKLFHNSTVEMTVTLYTKTNKGIVGHPYTSTIEFDHNHTNDGHFYIFYAFSLEDEELTRLVGASVTYTVEDELIEWNKQKDIDIDHALFLYEMFFPYTYWN